MSLLDKAKQSPGSSKFTKSTTEELELAIALLRGDVTTSQAASALGRNNHNTAMIYWAWRVLQEAASHDQLTVEIKS